MRWPLLCSFLVLACSGATQRPPPKATSAAPALPADAVWRQDVLTVVDRGLGRFLQHIDVEPHFSGTAFVGFRVMGLYPPSLWRNIDLRVGDIVTAVNGMPIERETEAYEAFQSLKKAPRLTVSYLRGGRAQQLSYRIFEGAAGPSPAQSPAKPAPSAHSGSGTTPVGNSEQR